MYIWRKMLLGYKTISYLLVAVILSLIIFPSHMHLHHEESSVSHKHAIDIHISMDQVDKSHHDDATVIDTISDVLIKKLNDNPLAPFILLTFVLVLAIAMRVSRHHRQNYPVHFFKCFYHISPPLRAPPTL